MRAKGVCKASKEVQVVGYWFMMYVNPNLLLTQKKKKKKRQMGKQTIIEIYV